MKFLRGIVIFIMFIALQAAFSLFKAYNFTIRLYYIEIGKDGIDDLFS